MTGNGEARVRLTVELAAFAEAVLRRLWEGYELDGADIQDLGLKHGLIRAVPYDPAVHSDILGVGPEPGDEWFEQIPELADLAAGRRALENSHDE